MLSQLRIGSPVVIAGILIWLASGCGQAPRSGGQSPTSEGTGEITSTVTATPSSNPPPEAAGTAADSPAWANPISGDPVPSFNDASKALSLPIVDPSFSSPTGVFVISKVGADLQALAITYDMAKYGKTVVIEDAPSGTADEWLADAKALVDANGTPGTFGTAELTTVRGGADALITTTYDGAQSDIRWLEKPGLEVWIRGPGLTQDDCIALANAF